MTDGKGRTPRTRTEWIAAARRRTAENGGVVREARASQRPRPTAMIALEAIPGRAAEIVASTREGDFHWVRFGGGTPATLPGEQVLVAPGHRLPPAALQPEGLPAVGAQARARSPDSPVRIAVAVLAYSPCRSWAWVRHGRNWPYAVPAQPDALSP